jgi:hypothetical protein
MAEARLLVALAALLALPGWVVLAATGLWRDAPRRQRWSLAAGLSLAFWPALLYAARALLPGLTFGPYKVGAFLALCAGIIVWRYRFAPFPATGGRTAATSGQTPDSSDPGLRGDWPVLVVLAATLFTRLWVLRDHPYPAWSDSLHHTLLTQLTATGGRLPADMMPYAPVPLEMYHLGLYALTAAAQWMGQVPAHQALLWTAQVVNALGVVGVFLVLDRRVGRLGALAGAAYVGLLSHQPAFYVNWGRFTQVAAQAVLPVAWLLTWEAVEAWGQSGKRARLWLVLAAGLLNGAVFLLHFRVAAFYVALLAVSAAWWLWRARRGGARQVRASLAGLAAVGVASLLVAAPALGPALSVYAMRAATPISAESALDDQRYYAYPLSTIPILAAHGWLLLLVGGATLYGLLRRLPLVGLMLAWIVALWAVGSAYRLGQPLLNVTNLGAILIMLYLPFGIIVGTVVEDAAARLRLPRATQVVTAAILLLGLVVGLGRIRGIEPYRYFVTEADVAAMDWIRRETPVDARFAINTYVWRSDLPHGTDGGYWIPYFTGRETTAQTMLFSLADRSFRDAVEAQSRAAEHLMATPAAVAELRALGVDYVYIGKQGHFAAPGLTDAVLRSTPGTEQMFARDGVSIWRLGPVE